MGLISEFKEFAMKGNVVDLAVGLVVGTAFGKIVTSLVNDVIMPPIGMLVGGVSFTDLKLALGKSEPRVLADGTTEAAKDVFINYGNFLQTAFDFLIVAAAVFAVMLRPFTSERFELVAPVLFITTALWPALPVSVELYMNSRCAPVPAKASAGPPEAMTFMPDHEVKFPSSVCTLGNDPERLTFTVPTTVVACPFS